MDKLREQVEELNALLAASMKRIADNQVVKRGQTHNI